jgi:two-component system NtrC family sensor kinase
MKKKIGFKLILVVGLTAIVIIGIYSFITIVSQSEVLLAEVERHAVQQSETMKNSTRYGMLLNQRDHIHQIINTVGAQPSIRDVRILNKEGVIIYSSHPDDIGKMVDKNAESCYVCHAEDKPIQRLSTEDRTRIFRTDPDSARVLGVINPIYTEPSCWNAPCHAHSKQQTVLGVLDVTMSLMEVDEQIRAIKIEVVAFAVVAIIAISLIIGIFVRRWVDTPVNELVKATKQVAGGNLNYTIANISQDEIGELERSFNIMTQKLAEARMQLFQSDKMASLGRLAAGVAHEINNPLTGILTYSSFLLKRNEHNKELHEDLAVILREAKRSREIVKSLLDFARQSLPRKEPADINEVIRKALKVVENQLGINKIEVVQGLDPSLPRVVVDANQMQQVFINLFVNAADAIGPGGGRISIDSSCTSLSPFGITQIKNATCPKNHSFIDTEFKIGGLPSIKLKAKTNGHEGFLYLDPVYGKHRNHYAVPFSQNNLVQLFCPECGSSLVDPDSKCPECSSPTYSLVIPGQGTLLGCTKFGCFWQRWESVDLGGEKQYIEINVSDTGGGIGEEDIRKIFEPFFSTKGQHGTGLGLAVIWGIINNHEGTITVKSQVGEGSNFRIRLPV